MAGRTVYTTEHGRTCVTCGWPVARCQCSARAEQAVPDKLVVRLRLETAHRRGKTVTVVEGLPRNQTFLKDLARELKRACGSGGTVVEERIEMQGDHLVALRALLVARGWKVKG